MDWFLYDNGLRYERVNFFSCCASMIFISGKEIAVRKFSCIHIKIRITYCTQGRIQLW